MPERLSDNYSDRDFYRGVGRSGFEGRSRPNNTETTDDGSSDRVGLAQAIRIVFHFKENDLEIGQMTIHSKNSMTFQSDYSLRNHPFMIYAINNILSDKNKQLRNSPIQFRDGNDSLMQFPYNMQGGSVHHINVVFLVDELTIDSSDLYVPIGTITFTPHPKPKADYEWKELRLRGNWARTEVPKPSKPAEIPPGTYAPSDVYRESSKHLPEFLPYPNYFKVVYIMKVDERYKDDDYQFIQDTNSI